ncbi:hypothetical protein NUW54_g5340 [Trametes sanguinea]|uniref:Uncharacterized protein n=1 Tax=Trametes sanguinea TaxID=158606 RepID=A0ACC1PYU0_9APHY|nr:hypothetical protein NUW54_g5340 [Trametes sanguinea]
MAEDDAERAASKLRQILSVQSGDLDEDIGIALTSLVTTAVHDEEPKQSLSNIVDAVKESGCASQLEPLTILPLVIGSSKDGADEMIDMLAKECSAKEVVMAIEEAVEILERGLQSEDEDDHGDHGGHVSAAIRTVRLIRAYAQTIPRLPRWKKAPKDTVESRLLELEPVISHLGREASVHEGRSIVLAISHFVLALSQGGDDDTKVRRPEFLAFHLDLVESCTQALLFHLINSAVGAFPNHFKAGLARKAFMKHFTRLVVPHSQPSSNPEGSEDVLTDVWSALGSSDITTQSCEATPSIATFILLAHEASYTFPIPTLTTFYPAVLSALQANVALDEILAVLINSLAPLRASTPRPDLEADLVIPLGTHPAPHSEQPLRPGYPALHLPELLADEDVPCQMRIAAIGLLKEALLEALSSKDQNLFASPHLLSTFGPIVLRPEPLNMFDTVTLEQFLEGPEPLRLVESLGFYYVLLQRDQHNRTGVRDRDSLSNVQRSLLAPLERRLGTWKTELATTTSEPGEDDRTLQLDILEMWTKRVHDALIELLPQAGYPDTLAVAERMAAGAPWKLGLGPHRIRKPCAAVHPLNRYACAELQNPRVVRMGAFIWGPAFVFVQRSEGIKDGSRPSIHLPLMASDPPTNFPEGLDMTVVTANMVGVILSTMTYGVLFALFVSLMRSYHRTARRAGELNKREWHMLLYGCALFVLTTVALCLQTWINHDAFVMHLAFPGGPIEYLTQNARSPANLAMTFLFIVLNWLADGMLLYRCYALFDYAKLALVGCCLAQMALVVVGCVFLKDISMLSIDLWVDVKTAPSLAYLSCSLIINAGLTLVIIIRLIYVRSRISGVLGSRHTRVYYTLVAILIESAAPYTIVAFIAIIACAKRSPLQIAMLPISRSPDSLFLKRPLFGICSLERQADGKLLDKRPGEAGVLLPTLEDEAHERVSCNTDGPVRFMFAFATLELVRV